LKAIRLAVIGISNSWWNPEKELKGGVFTDIEDGKPVLVWNPEKELKERHSSLIKLVAELKWNPEKELKVLDDITSLEDV